MTTRTLEEHLTAIEEEGYTILERVLSDELVDELNDALLRLERDEDIAPADNDFEGRTTVRIYNLLARDPAFQKVPIHEAVLPVIEGVLDPGCLVSSLSSISIDPGEEAQPIHSDDQVIGLPRPHPPLVCNSMWALTEFTEENGATRIVPGSHKSPDYPAYGKGISFDSIPAEMPRGSVLVWNGSLWHGGGANQSKDRRVGIAMNYCAGFIRQQENQQLGIPLDLAGTFSPRLQALCGFGTYRALIGHIDKQSPAQRLFGEDKGYKSIWDLT